MMKFRYKPLIIAILSMVAIDVTGTLILILKPNLIPRGLFVFIYLQFFGFIMISISLIRCFKKPGTRTFSLPGLSKDWVSWFCGGLAVVYLVRALLAVAYLAGHGWHSLQAAIPAIEIGFASCLFYLTYVIRKRTKAESPGDDRDIV